MRVLTDNVADAIRSRFSEADALNPKGSTSGTFDESYAIASGVTLNLELSYFDNTDEGEPVFELSTCVFSRVDVDEDIPANEPMRNIETGPYADIAADLDDLFTEMFETYERHASLDLAYRGSRSGYEDFFQGLFHITGDNLPTVDTTDITVTLSLTEPVTRTIPSSVVEEGTDAIEQYVQHTWWSNLSAAEKARVVGLSNEIVAVSTDVDLSDEFGVSFRIE